MKEEIQKLYVEYRKELQVGEIYCKKHDVYFKVRVCPICLNEFNKKKVYILKKNCPNIGKEIGDYYNNEYSDSIKYLLNKGIIEEEINL